MVFCVRRSFEGCLYLGVSGGEKTPELAAGGGKGPRGAFHDVLELCALSVACQRRSGARLSA